MLKAARELESELLASTGPPSIEGGMDARFCQLVKEYVPLQRGRPQLRAE